jgi:hypothetical protein
VAAGAILDAMTPEARSAVERRVADRRTEYDHLKTEYDELAAEGLIRVQDGVLQVADPRTAATAEAPRGAFRDVGGDIDIYEITLPGGTPLDAVQRKLITSQLRSLGINVEHGFHTAWAEDSPQTHDPAADERIRAEHRDRTPLIAFVPKSSPREVWAGDLVTSPRRTEGPGDRYLPLESASGRDPTTEPGPGEPGAGPDLTSGESDFSDVGTAVGTTPSMPDRVQSGGGGEPGHETPRETVSGGGSGGGTSASGKDIQSRFDTTDDPGRAASGGGESQAAGRTGTNVHSRFDLSDVVPHLWDDEMVAQAGDATNSTHSQEIFEGMASDDPKREVGLYRNPTTGEYIVIQGRANDVAVERIKGKAISPKGGGQVQRWKELLDAGSDVGHWELVAHVHPSGRSYPSLADFRVIIQASMRDNQPRESAIVVKTRTGFDHGTFAFEPQNNEPYVVRPIGEPPLRFATLEEYRHFLEHRFEGEVGEIPQWVLDYERQIAEARANGG